MLNFILGFPSVQRAAKRLLVVSSGYDPLEKHRNHKQKMALQGRHLRLEGGVFLRTWL